MERRKKLTKSSVEAIPIPETGEAVLWDTEVRGFHVRVRPSGRRTYFYFYRNEFGQQRKPRVGEHGPGMTAEVARARAVDLHARVALGADPSADRMERRDAMTLSQYWPRYLAYAEARWKAGTLENNRCRWSLHIEPAFGSSPMVAITKTRITRFHEQLKDSPIAANRCLALLRAMFNRAVATGEFSGENPAAGVEPYPEKARETFLDDEQLAILFEAIRFEESIGGVPVQDRAGTSAGRGGKKKKEIESRGISSHAGALFRLLALTGARLSEIRTARWEYVDWKGNALRLPDSKTGKKPIWLTETAVAVLKAHRDAHPRAVWMIEGRDPTACLANARKAWYRVRERAAKIAEAVEDAPATAGAIFRTLNIHDLRHTHASMGITSGLSLAMVGKLLGHKSERTTRRYAHIADRHAADAVAKVGERQKAAVVIDLTKKIGSTG